MKTKTTRQVDSAGRVSLPGYLRKIANINPGDVVTVEVDTTGVIKISQNAENCCICDEGVSVKDRVEVTIGPEKKLFCRNCVAAIIRAKESGK